MHDKININSYKFSFSSLCIHRHVHTLHLTDHHQHTCRMNDWSECRQHSESNWIDYVVPPFSRVLLLDLLSELARACDYYYSEYTGTLLIV